MPRNTQKLYLTRATKGYIIHKKRHLTKCKDSECVSVGLDFFRGILYNEDLPEMGKTKPIEVFGED